MGALQLILAFLICVCIVPDVELSFNLLFKSNKRTYTREALHFEKELPQWLRGVLVNT